MTLSKDEYRILDAAYAKLKMDMKPETEACALRTLEVLEGHFKEWNGELEQLLGIYTTEMADSISASGMAGIFLPDFKTFLAIPATAAKLKLLYDLRLSATSYNFELATRVKGIGLINHLEDCKEYFKNGKPLLYTHRMLVMNFIDLFTTIADEAKLKKVKGKLNVVKTQFEYSQFELRAKVNEYIKLKEIEWENRFVKAAIAWYVE